MENINYKELDQLYNQYIDKSKDLGSNLANITAILYQLIDDINWLGFYLYDKNEEKLILGPFQGRPAIDEIAITSGVCGTCARNKETIIVDNVHDFCGHIACDLRSKSEIVVPIFNQKEELFAIIDVDAPSYARFTTKEKELLEYLGSKMQAII